MLLRRVQYPSELEVKRNVIYDDESGGGTDSGGDEQENRGPEKKHLNGEDPAFSGLTRHIKSLTERKGNEQHTERNETSDDTTTVPREFIPPQL
jgi:hypothetical protein